jgi:hypothetical protein
MGIRRPIAVYNVIDAVAPVGLKSVSVGADDVIE